MVCAVLVGLLAPAAGAATAAPTMVAAASWVAGHPVTIACDAALDGHAASLQAGLTPLAWTPYGGNIIYAQPSLCDETSATIGSQAFAQAIGTIIHEATHARGVVSESCAELTADVGVFDVLRRFYDVPFFSATSVLVGAEVLGLTRARPANYQPEACWRSGLFG